VKRNGKSRTFLFYYKKYFPIHFVEFFHLYTYRKMGFDGSELRCIAEHCYKKKFKKSLVMWLTFFFDLIFDPWWCDNYCLWRICKINQALILSVMYIREIY
jgi:hypothetical protein